MSNRQKSLFSALLFTLFMVGQVGASRPTFSLTDLVEDSDLIAQGTLVFNDCTEHCVFQFVSNKVFKNKASDDKKIMVCSFPRPDSNRLIDMKYFKGEIIIFTKKEGECYRPLGGHANVVKTITRSDGTIDASGIREEPLRQTLKEFQDKIEKEVRKGQTKK